MDSFEKLRPVGRLERYSTARHDLKFFINVGVTASYTLPDTCSFPLKNYVYEASKTLIGRHPILSAIVVDENTNSPQFVRLPEIHLDRCVFFERRRNDVIDAVQDERDPKRDIELDELLRIQHNISFTAPDPFWRLCILTNAARPYQFTASFLFHHALSDGQSGKAFHHTFRQALSEATAATGDGLVPIVTPPSIPLLPNVEEIHPMPVSLLYLITVLFKEKVWSWRDPGLWTGGKIMLPLQNRFRHLPFSLSDTASLLKVCRAHSTTVTAALQTIVARALFKLLPEQFTKVACAGAVSSRRWLSDAVTDDCMGDWVQAFSDSYSRDKLQTVAFPWDEAKRARDTINKELELQGKDTSVNLLRYIGDFHRELFLSKVGRERDSTFELSNVGVLKVGTKGEVKGDKQGPDVKIGRMVFSQSASVTGSALEVAVITGGDGCLVLGFTWQKGVVEDTMIEKIVENVKKEIEQLVTNE